ncbi:hypothetical protein L4X63_20025 [Geomonas sp. Red32]|uniref:hypothetical protein n=1 Tax=Geomonas sp. Red32 TaxID=2912856 RepID=UPI00202CCED8|nr:hypothetical protein [Geomonas sp. Red32]MCM0083877.1 hypothetical protein [Geomonas sp. Red32]
MSEEIREERVRELSESNYLMLRQSYRMVQELKGMMDRFHAGCLQGSPPDFDTLTAMKITVTRLYDDMERYLRPECDPDSAHPDAMIEKG